MSTSEELKRRAAETAVEQVRPGMVVGLGTGSTAAFAVAAIARRQCAEGFRIIGIPTSEATAELARRGGIELSDLASHPVVDLTIDGADAVDPDTLALIKGLGGALLREKIVAAASRSMTVIVDETKVVGRIGSRTPVPVEIVRFGAASTLRRLGALTRGPANLRLGGDGEPFVTDGGNYIADCAFGPIDDPAALHARIKAEVGVIESGLFIGLADRVVIAGRDGIHLLRARPSGSHSSG